MAQNTPKVTFYWRNGKREVLDGRNYAEALSNGGYRLTRASYADHIKNCECSQYKWNPKIRQWE